MTPVLPDATAIAGVTLRSADVARGAAFYRDVAGLDELGDGVVGWRGTPLITLTPMA